MVSGGAHLHANPQGGTVVAGQASIETPAQGHLVVRQGSARAVIDWRSFSIGAGEHTQFVQPSASSVALNRVTGPDPSVIAGRLSANGRIVLQNEAGVTFSEGAQVNASSLLATTSRIDAQRLMNTGEVAAHLPGRVAGARVENRGDITVADSGVAALVGPEVRNSGRIVARQGRVVLGGAETYTIDLAGDGLVAFEVRDGVSRAPSDGGAVVVNTGTIEAPGGQVVVSARAARGVVDDVIFAGGRIAATAVHQEGGTIVLGGGDAGTVTVAGNLDVSGAGAGQRGGRVDVRGERIVVRSGARIDASGRSGGGTVKIGGDLKGQGPGPNARSVVVEPEVAILADATARGDGGTTIVWSDEVTRFWGRISARGGPEGGDGGFAEVSSKGWLDYRGIADLRATLGQVGVLLLDPTDLMIAASGDENVVVDGPPTDPIRIGPGLPADPPTVSVLSTTTLETQLGLSNVVVTTVGSPDVAGQTGRIDIVAGFAIPDGRTLTLEAAGAITQAGAAAITTPGSATLAMLSGLEGSGNISLEGSIALGPAGVLVLDATGGGTGAGGQIAQTGGLITTAELLARAAGAVSFTNTAAGTVAGSATGSFSVTDTSGGLTVGTVQGVSGITASGAAPSVTLRTPGDLTVSQAIAAATGPVALTTGAGGRLTVNETVTAGRVAVTADQIAVNAALGAGATGVDITTVTAGRPILVGSGTGGSQLGNPDGDTTALAVNQAEFDRLGGSTAAVRLSTGSGTIAIEGAPPATSVGLDLGTRRLLLATGNGSGSAITQTHRIVGGAGAALAASAAGSVVLTDGGNDVPLIAGRAGGAATSFAYTAAAGVTVGTVPGGGGIVDVAGIVTTGAPITLNVNGALAVHQALTAPGATVSLINAGTAAITQAAAGAITANRLAIQSGGPATLADAANQVASFAATTAGGLAFRTVPAATVAARNTGSGAIAITGQNSLTIGSDALLGLTGVQNLAGAVTLDAAATLLVNEAVSATSSATLRGVQVVVNDTVGAPNINVAADLLLSIDPLTGALGTAGLQEAVLRTRTAGRPISLGAIAAGELSIGAAQLDRIGVGAGPFHLRIGSVGGALRPGEAATGTLTIRSTADFSGRALTLEAGAAGAAVAQDAGAAVFAGSLVARAAQGSVLLGQANNAVGTLAGAAPDATADFEFRGLGNVTLGSLTHGTDAAVAGITAGQTVRLGSVVGTVQQTAAAPIVAQNLLARSDLGAVNLTESAANSVGTIAGNGFSGFRYRDADSVTVGTIAPSVAFPGLASGIATTLVGAPVTLIAGTDLALAAPIAAANGTVRLQAGQDLTQTAAGVVTADALLARATRDVLLDGTGGNLADTFAAQAGRELWYRSAQTFTVGSVTGDGLVAEAVGATGGTGGVVRLAATSGAGITINNAIAGAGVELAADLVGINATVGAAADLVVVRPFSAGREIALGNLIPEDIFLRLYLPAHWIDRLGGATTTLRIGSADNAGEAASGALIVRGTAGNTATGIRVNRLGQPGDARTLVLESGTAGLAISQSGPITGGASATLVAAAPAGEVFLGDTANDVGTIAGTAGTAGFRYRSGGTVTVGQSAAVSVGAGIPLVVAGRDGIRPGGASLPITLLAGGNLSIARPLDAGTQTIRLEADGALSQTADGTLSAGALLARGGTVDLTGPDNRIGVLAGSAGTSGGFRFRHAGPLAVGVGGISTTNAPLTIISDSGLTLLGPLTAGTGTVRLRALAGDITQSGGTITAGALALSAEGGSVTLDALNTVGTLAGEAASLFRFVNASDLAVGQISPDGALVAAADGVRLGAGVGTVNLAAGGFGSVVLDRPIDAGAGAVTLQAGLGANSHVQQTATGGITASSLTATASAGAVDLASAGAANAVGSITGIGRDGFRFRAAGPLAVGAGGIGTTDAPLTLVSGSGLTLLGSLSAGTGTVRLRATSGDITQSAGSITAGALALSADSGSIDVSRPGNAFDVFAGAAQGALVFDVAGALTVAAIGPDGPAESQAGVVNPAAVLVPGFAGATSSNGAVQISTGGLLTVSGTASAGTDVILSSQQGLTLSGAVVAGGDATLNAAGALSVTDTGSVVAGQAATLDAGGAITLAGSVQAGTTATLDAAQSLAVAPTGSVQATTGAAVLSAGGTLDVAGSVGAGGSASLTAADSLFVSGTVQAGTTATLGAGATLDLAGTVDAGGSASLTAAGSLFVGGTVQSGTTATLGAGATLDVSGMVDAGGSANLTAGGVLSVGGTVQAADAVTLAATHALDVWGTVSAGGDAGLASGTWMMVNGTVQAGGAATLASGSWLDLWGTVVSGLDATLSAAADLRLLSGGLVRTSGSASLAASTFLIHEGVVDADGSATLSAGQWMWVPGSVLAGGDATLTAGTEMSLLGLIAAAGDAALTAGQGLTVAAGGAVLANRTASLDAAAALTVDGAVAGATGVDLAAGAALVVNTGGTVTSGGDATLAASGPIVVGGELRADGSASLDTPGGISVPGRIAAVADATLAAGQDIAVGGTVEAGGTAALGSGQAIAVAGRVQAGLDAVLDAATTLNDDGTISAGRDALLTAQQAMTIAGTSVFAGQDAVLTAAGPLTIIGRVEAGRNVILSSGLDLSISGTVLAAADALIGAAGGMLITGSASAGPGGVLILGFGTDFTLEGRLGVPDGRVMIRRAAPLAAGSTGLISLDGGAQQFALGGTPRMIVIDSSGDLRPLGTADPGIDVGLLRGTLAALIAQTPDQIAATRVVRLFGFPSFVARVTGTVTQFGQAGADVVQSNVDVSLGAINAPNALLYVFGENGSVTSNTGFDNALTLRAVGVYVNEASEVAIFGVINGVAGDNASTFVQRLGDPQFRQRINNCAIGTIGCTFLPLSQEPAIYIPPVVLLAAGAPRFDESAVPIVNTGPEDVLRAGGEGEQDEQDETGAVQPSGDSAG